MVTYQHRFRPGRRKARVCHKAVGIKYAQQVDEVAVGLHPEIPGLSEV